MDDRLRDAQIDRLREAVATLHADQRELAAELRGRLDTLAAAKAGDVARLEAAVGEERHKRRNLEVAVEALHNRLDRFPRPEEVIDGIALAHANQLSLARLAGIVAVAGSVGGVASQLFAGG